MKREMLVLAALLMVVSGLQAIVIEDFENVSDWGAGGPRGSYSSVSTVAGQVGDYAGSFNYSLSEATGGDYVDFYNDRVLVDFTAGDTLKLKMQLPVDTDMIAQLRIYSSTGGFIEHDFAAGTGLWQDYILSLADDFTDYGTNPNLSTVNLIVFRINGDVSANATSGSVLVDQMELVPEPATIALLASGFGIVLKRRNCRK